MTIDRDYPWFDRVKQLHLILSKVSLALVEVAWTKLPCGEPPSAPKVSRLVYFLRSALHQAERIHCRVDLDAYDKYTEENPAGLCPWCGADLADSTTWGGDCPICRR